MSAVAPSPSNPREHLRTLQIAPSILAADPARLGAEVQAVLDAGARVIHFDVMDGHFVPPITFGAATVAALADRVHAAGAAVDVHLMVSQPERHIDDFASVGADLITVHAEATAHLHRLLGQIREAGCLAGVAINPGTPAQALLPVAELIDLALVMTVNPGWGGQKFIASTAREKLPVLREALAPGSVLQVDGGVDLGTAPGCAALGASLLVAGSAVFARKDTAGVFAALTDALRAPA